MRPGADLWLGLLTAAIIAAVSLLPMLRLLAESLDLAVAAQLTATPAFWRALTRSLVTSLGGSLVALIVGTGLAVAVVLTDIRGRRWVVLMALLPLLIPSQIIALAWIELLSPNNPLLILLGLAPEPGTPNPLYSPGGIILLLGVEHVPLVFLAARGALLAVPGELIEAAQAEGAGAGPLLRRIVLPLIFPALLAGLGLAFVSCLGNFGIPALLGIPARYQTVPVLIYQRLSGFGPSILAEAGLMALVLAVISGLVILAARLWIGSQARALIGSAGRSGVLHLPLRRWRTPILILLLALGLLMSVLPLLSLLATALTRAYGLPLMVETATLAHFTRVLTAPQTLRALLNSLWLSGAAAVLLAALALPFAVVEAWSPAAWLRRLLRAFDPIIEAPYALPGVVLGIAIILLLIRPLPLLNISLYGTATLILIAYLARFLPLILRPVQASLRQIDPVLDEAGQAQGAGFLERFRRITLPLLLPSAVAGGVLVFLTAFSELTVSSLLWSRGNETVGIIIYFLEEGGDAPGAAAMSMICLAVIFTLAGLCTRLPLGVRRLLPWGV